MNILFLSNSAPNYFHFFNALAKLFAQDGAKIYAAVDSAFSREENKLDDVGFATIHEFSDFFSNHQIDRDILERYSSFNLNGALLSDFERAQIYDIWGDVTDLEYFDRLKSALLTFFEKIFIRYEIDFVIYENVSNAFAHYALFVSQKLGATYYGLAGSRLPGRFALTSDPLVDDATERAFNDIRAGKLIVDESVRDWARNYIANIETITPDYMKINKLDRLDIAGRYLQRNRWNKVQSLARHAFDSRTAAFQIGNPLRTHANLFLRNLKRRMRASSVRKIYDKPVSGERYLLYPIHFHPEASTSILAGAYLDEYEVIRNIAFNLPEGVRLYVKDHLSAWAYPSMEFYEKVTRLPNVRLLGPSEPTKHLIKQSEAVITLTSTVGYEALLLNKKVFVFGRVFYDFHVGVEHIRDPAKMFNIIRKHLECPHGWDGKYNDDFIAAYHYATLPGILNLMQDEDAAVRLAGDLYPVIKGHF